jgi:class 3 adenylate cyclase/pimeloyl-ACP methyl ester carboxylesterase
MHYARNGDVRLAYRVYGEGDTTVVWVPTMMSSIDAYDDASHPWGVSVQLLSRDVRIVVWDSRGTGLSDPVTQAPSLEQRVDDLRVVLDATETECPTLFGPFVGGPLSIAFAASYPKRVRALVLYATAARFMRDPPDFPWGFTQAEVDAQVEDIEANWGEGALAEFVFGAAAEVPGVRDTWGRMQSSLVRPTMASLLWRAHMAVDVRDLLAAVRAPATVSARPGDALVPFEASAALAADLPNGELVTLPAGAHSAYDITDLGVSMILKACAKPTAIRGQRVLATLLFTDIVGSTEQLSAAGDERWRHQLDTHDAVVDNLLIKHGGRRVKHTGDGVFALFDTPSAGARCALDLVSALATRGIHIRAGVHVGECEKRGDEWSGMAVHVGARIGALAGAGEVLTSRTVRDLSAGSGLNFESLGAQRLKGIPEDTEVFRVATPTGVRS